MTERLVNHIKSVSTKKFEIGIYETPEGYVVAYTTGTKEVIGKPVTDYNLAAWVFEKKLTELEAH